MIRVEENEQGHANATANATAVEMRNSEPHSPSSTTISPSGTPPSQACAPASGDLGSLDLVRGSRIRSTRMGREGLE